MTKKILILGSTGSIGTQALEVIADNPDLFTLVGIAAGGSNPALAIAQAEKFNLRPGQVAVADRQAAAEVGAALGGTVLSGADAAQDLVDSTQATNPADTVLNALVGSLGLGATLATLRSGAKLALANKESLVAGGDFVMAQAQPGQIIPVDSEHSAMAQCLRSGTENEVARIVLTASGGPFRGWNREQMWDVTPEQAAAHPTWSMGQMNTLNSATLINKGLELIEATLLFDTDADLIDVSVHPQSIIHSMITFQDGGTIAQASPPSMKLPIALAMNWPHRVPGAQHAWTSPRRTPGPSNRWMMRLSLRCSWRAGQRSRRVLSRRCTTPPMRRPQQPSSQGVSVSRRSLMLWGKFLTGLPSLLVYPQTSKTSWPPKLRHACRPIS